MKKTLAVLALAISVLAGTAGCPSDTGGSKPKKICKPYTVREDGNEAGVWWRCNKDGTKEFREESPQEQENPIDT